MPVTRSTANRPLRLSEPNSSSYLTRSQKSHRGSDNRDDNEVWVAKKLRGRYPPLTDFSKSAVDAVRGKVYFYGGCRPKDERQLPTPYFHVFDTETMKFGDLTNSLTHITPGDPNSDVKPDPKIKKLPSLSQPGVAFLEIGGDPMVFLFGGHDVDNDDGPSSTLVAINVNAKMWYYVEFERTESRRKPAPRIDPIVIGIQEKLYIFSGLKGFGDKWVYHRSFSIIDFCLGKRSKWIAIDAPYPASVPSGQAFGKGLSIYDGKMILLLPGRKQEKEKIPFLADNIFHFIVKNNTFIKASVKGIRPNDVAWYYVSNLDRALNSPQGILPYGTPEAVPSVIVCTWLPYGDEDLSPELWKYTVFPINTFVRLGVIDRIYDLEVNFQRFALLGSRAFLMGQGDYLEKTLMCNTYVEIPLPELLIKPEPD